MRLALISLYPNTPTIRNLAHAHPTAKFCKCVAWKGFCERVCELIVRRGMLVLENTTGADVAEKLNVRRGKIRFALISLYPNTPTNPELGLNHEGFKK